MELLLFYIFSTILIFSALNVIFNKNPVESVLFLVISFCNASGLLILLEVEYLAILFIVVYVGAIAVLFLFVIMMLNIRKENSNSGSASYSEYYQYIPFVFFLGMFLLVEIYFSISKDFISLNFSTFSGNYVKWIDFVDAKQTTNIEILGQIMYTYYVFYFLVCGLILLVALIATISLTLQVKPLQKSQAHYLKRQKVYQQLSRNPQVAIFNIKLYERSLYL